MNLQEIKALIDAMAASDLREMTLTRDGMQLRLVRSKTVSVVAAPQQAPETQQPPTLAPAHVRRQTSPTAASAATRAPSAITAPLYGVVHWRPSPDAPPFVAPGQTIKAGQVVCVVEAMKVFNEIRTDVDATVQALLVESGAEVEAGQPLLSLG